MHRSLLSVVLSLCVLLSALVGAHAASYTFAPFDVPGAIRTEAYGINDAGQIVGNYQDASAATHGFLYTAGIFTSLDVPGALTTYAQGINNRGQIVGTTRSRVETMAFSMIRGSSLSSMSPCRALSPLWLLASTSAARSWARTSWVLPIMALSTMCVFTTLDVPDASDRNKPLALMMTARLWEFTPWGFKAWTCTAFSTAMVSSRGSMPPVPLKPSRTGSTIRARLWWSTSIRVSYRAFSMLTGSTRRSQPPRLQ